MMENVLLEADTVLFDFFCERGITSTIYAWPLLHSTMSEVLSVSDWLILWDHLFSIRKPWFLMLCTIAYSILYRKTITTKLHKIDDFEQFYKTVVHVSIKNILKIAHKLDRETPHRIHPSRYLRYLYTNLHLYFIVLFIKNNKNCIEFFSIEMKSIHYQKKAHIHLFFSLNFPNI